MSFQQLVVMKYFTQKACYTWSTTYNIEPRLAHLIELFNQEYRNTAILSWVQDCLTERFTTVFSQ